MRILLVLIVLSVLVVPVSALEITAPEVPDSGRDLMPEQTESFSQGLLEIIRNALPVIAPDFAEAGRVCLRVIAASLLLSVLKTFEGQTGKAASFAGIVAVGSVLLTSTNSLVNLASDTVAELSNYGKLLLPVMTAAAAAQGGITSSAALYTGTAFFSALLSSSITRVLIPLNYIYLALAVGNRALGENMMKKIQDVVKWFSTWLLKTILYVFTGYMGITGVMTGGTDAAALKATKLTISGMVPVVGGILADASESVLVGVGVMKNAVGVYGLLAILAICLGPFLKIGIQYLMLKVTGAVCSMLDSESTGGLVQDFSGAMGLLLGMTGAVCLQTMIGIVCFLREVGS